MNITQIVILNSKISNKINSVHISLVIYLKISLITFYPAHILMVTWGLKKWYKCPYPPVISYNCPHIQKHIYSSQTNNQTCQSTWINLKHMWLIDLEYIEPYIIYSVYFYKITRLSQILDNSVSVSPRNPINSSEHWLLP